MKISYLLIGVISVATMFSCGTKSNQQSEEKQLDEYPVMTVKKQDANFQLSYPVTIKGQEDVEIKPRVDGHIEAIYVDEGSTVKAGQPLFRINSPASEQALTSARASVSSAKAQVSTAKLNVDRYRPLAEKGIVSQVQLQTYENSYQTALATLEQAEAVLKNAQATISWATVTSPVGGVVGEILFRVGSLVNNSSKLTQIANTNSVYAYFSINEKKLMEFLDDIEGNTQSEKIKNIPSVTLILADGSEYPEKGRIETIAGVVDVTTGTANFRAEFSNKAGKLRSGTSGKVLIPKKLENVFVIPQKSTFKQQDKVLVYKLQADSVAQQLVSIISLADGVSYAVTEGLSEGDQIVSDGIITLNNGKKIRVAQDHP